MVNIPNVELEFLGPGDGSGTNETAYLRQTVGIREEIPFGITLIGHRLELDDLENLGILSWAVLKKEGSSSLIGEMKPHRDHQQQR